jgi:hypothetical protein
MNVQRLTETSHGPYLIVCPNGVDNNAISTFSRSANRVGDPETSCLRIKLISEGLQDLTMGACVTRSKKILQCVTGSNDREPESLAKEMCERRLAGGNRP